MKHWALKPYLEHSVAARHRRLELRYWTAGEIPGITLLHGALFCRRFMDALVAVPTSKNIRSRTDLCGGNCWTACTRRVGAA